MVFEKFLKNLGLEEKEQKVYIALLKLGDGVCGRVAKGAQIKRTTAYHILENLEGKGLISSYTERGVRRFVAENPSRLKDILDGQFLALEKYLPQLRAFYNLAKAKAEVRFFEGEEGAKQVSEDVLASGEKNIYSLGSIKNVKEATGVSICFGKRRIAKKIFEKALRVRKEFDESYAKRQKEEFKEVRFLPENFEVPVLILIYGRKVGVICSKEEGFSFIIESDDFSKTTKLIFEALWNIYG